MFVSPSKVKKNKFLRGRTINFETPTRTKENMVIIATDNKQTMEDTISSTLFRPMQLMALYTPRRIKPIGKSPIMISQKDYYAEVREATDGRIKKGKTVISSYNSQNLIYDFYNYYNLNVSTFKERNFKNQRLQKLSYQTMESFIKTASSDPDYKKVYLVFPMEEPLPNPQRVFISNTDYSTTNPMALFIYALSGAVTTGSINMTAYSKIDKVLFYAPKQDILLVLDLKDPELQKNLTTFIQRLKRLNGFLAGTEDISSEIETEEQGLAELTPEDKLENRKEDIKKAVFQDVAKTLKANNLTDFEAATSDEKDIMVSIDKKVDDYLAKPENLKKTFNDMVGDIGKDSEVKAKATRYVETKKANIIRADDFEKSLEKETTVIGAYQDDTESDDDTADEFNVKEPYIDKRVEKSKLATFDEEYEKKQKMKDITNVVSAFSENPVSPLAVDSLTFKDTSDYQNETDQLEVKYKTDDGKNISVSLEIPKVIGNRYFFLGGNKKVIKKQLVQLPIVKTKSDTVEITTNYQKITMTRTTGKYSRKNAYFLKMLEPYMKNKLYTIKLGNSMRLNNSFTNDFEFEELACHIFSIDCPKWRVLFNRSEMADEIELLDVPDNFVKDSMTPLAFEKSGENTVGIVYIENGEVWEYDIKSKVSKKIRNSMFDFLVIDVLNTNADKLPTIGKSFIYTEMKFLMVKYPVFAVAASQVGIQNLMKRYTVDYHFSRKREMRNIKFVEVPFKDGFLYYEDTMRNTLLLNALYLPAFNTKEYNFSEFDADIPYTHFFMRILGDSIGIHTRSMLQINLSVMVDPITRDVLRDNNLPTDIIDMLLYGNSLLVGSKYKPRNDFTNYRIRSTEIVSDILYHNLSTAYVNYQNHRINGGRPTSFNLQPGAVRKELLTQQNITDQSTQNPVFEAEDISRMSAKGYRGININQAYTLEMRSYDKSMNGVVSGNATPYSGQAGITRDITYDAKINGPRGYLGYNDPNSLSATNMLSPTELLSSFTAAQADPPRQAMQVAQTGHTMAIMHPSKQLIGSGVNKTLAYLISDEFCFKAKLPGVVTKIDNTNKLAMLKYDNGTEDAIDLDSKLDKNSNMGFYVRQLFKMCYAEGEHFEAGDILAYNPAFFSGKGKDVDYKPGVLAKMAICPGDFSFEDSTLISESLGEKAATRVNILKQIALDKNSIVSYLADVGDKVSSGDPLVKYSSGTKDADAVELLKTIAKYDSEDSANALTTDEVDTKVTGTVTAVDIFYNCKFEELDSSMQAIIKKYQKRLSAKEAMLKDVHTGSVHVPPLEEVHPRNNKIGKKDFPEDGGAIINIYVEYIDVMGMGDKLTYTTALKGVVSRVLKDSEAPLSDYRPEEPVQAILTPLGVISRMTSDIYSLLYGNKVLVELGKQIREIWNGER